MDAYSAYAYSTGAWLSLQALPPSLFPKLMVAMLSAETRAPTDLEIHSFRILAIIAIYAALLNIIFSGALPLSNPANEAEYSPFKTATATLTTFFHTLSLIYVYVNYPATGSVCFVLAMVGSGFLACFGIWVMVFGGDNGGKSRVSGWPFRNDEEMKAKNEKTMRKRG